MNDSIKLIYVDLFCGAGGTSTGVESALIEGKKCARVVACVNHDPLAIASHAANHPETMHFTEDIRTLNLEPIIRHLEECREKYPNALVVLWASLECTNFSKAKGGQPRHGESRTLAEHLFRYIDAIKPSYIQIENVEEFMSWGDLDAIGHPVSKDKGRCYVKWCNEVISRGYQYDFRILNAADFGAYTCRKRFFGLFAKDELPIAFPLQTYSKNGDNDGGLFQIYKKWKPVREVLDLQDEGVSIFIREKPLCEKTLERIFAGLVKYVAGGKQQFLVMQYGNGSTMSVDAPAGAVTTNPKHILVSPQWLMYTYFNNNDLGIEVYETDSPMTVKIKEFMAAYRIIDIKMRMLNIQELKRIMGFPVNYILKGSKAVQKKFIGNAVEVNMSRVLCEALCNGLQHKKVTT